MVSINIVGANSWGGVSSLAATAETGAVEDSGKTGQVASTGGGATISTFARQLITRHLQPETSPVGGKAQRLRAE
jgi:hypothetical protein